MDGKSSCCGMSCCTVPTRQKARLDAKIPQSEISGVYDRLSGFYDIWGLLTESRARRRAIELAAITNGQNILEVAVGTGLAFYEIVKRNPNGRTVGIDLSEGMLKRARKRLLPLQGAYYVLTRGTAFDLKVETGSLDLLVNNYMFDLLSFEEMDSVLEEFRRALRKGGKLVLVNMTVGVTAAARVYDFLYRLSPRMMGGCRGVHMTEMLLRKGFEVERREYVQQMLFPSEIIIARS